MKALYSCINSGFLWYNLFTSTLEYDGFVLNPYDSCVANKQVNDKQYTITCYVYYLKTSHIKPKVLEDVLNTVETRYGKMTVARVIKHTYVGIYIEFISNGKIALHQKQHLEECIQDLVVDLTTSVTTLVQH